MTATSLTRRRALLAGLALPAAAALPGCASLDPAEYADQKPALDLTRYFDGMIDGWGMVQDRSGSYDAAFVGAAVLFLASSLVVLALGRYPRFEPAPPAAR